MRLAQPDLPRTAITKLKPAAHLDRLPPTLDARDRVALTLARSRS